MFILSPFNHWISFLSRGTAHTTKRMCNQGNHSPARVCDLFSRVQDDSLPNKTVSRYLRRSAYYLNSCWLVLARCVQQRPLLVLMRRGREGKSLFKYTYISISQLNIFIYFSPNDWLVHLCRGYYICLFVRRSAFNASERQENGRINPKREEAAYFCSWHPGGAAHTVGRCN